MLSRIFLLCWALCVLTAAEPPTANGLELRLSPGTAAPRAGAPVPVLLTAVWEGTELRTGRPHLAIRGDTLLGQWTGPELTIATGGRTVRLWLPPWWDGTTPLEADLTWEENGRTYPLGRFELVTQPSARRALALWSITSAGGEPGPPMEMMALERQFAPAINTGIITSPPLTTLVQRCPVAEAPATPAQWCAADGVWLGPQAATALDERQWSSLDAWLHAGGAVWLTGTSGLPEARLKAWGLDESSWHGRLAHDAVAAPFITRIGHGQLIVAEGNAVDATLAQTFWRCAISPDTAGMLPVPDNMRRMGHSDYYDNSHRDRPDLVQALMPTNVAVVPLWVLLAIYAGYLLLVGPGEWFGLGRLGLRRWTWVVFPITTALATGLTMAVAYGYLGGQDHHRTLEVIDCDVAGKALRTVRFDLHFTGGDRDLIDVAPAGLTASVHRSGGGRRQDEVDISSDVPSVISGDPGEVRLRLRQWSPLLRRTTIFTGPNAPTRPAWSATRSVDGALHGQSGQAPLPENLLRVLCNGDPGWNDVFRAQAPRPGNAWDDLALDHDVHLRADTVDGVVRVWRCQLMETPP